MSPLESMKKELRATGLYALSGATLVDAELASYAAGLQPVSDAIEELQRDLFVQTASGYGLSLRERLFLLGAEGDEAQRRAAVTALGAVTPRGFLRESIQKTLCGAGVLCEICEKPEEQTVYLNMGTQADTTQEQTQKIETAKRFLPAHLGAELDFRSISWNNIDQAGGTFDTWDAKGLSWDSVDQYENALLRI